MANAAAHANVRDMREADMREVKRMMRALWPDADVDAQDFENEPVMVFERDGQLCGFVSYSVRPYVEGTDTAPCPHLEGWYVDPAHRRQGVGRALIRALEARCVEKGFSELTSDVEVDNQISLDAHGRLGFQPTARVQYFKKRLDRE